MNSCWLMQRIVYNLKQITKELRVERMWDWHQQITAPEPYFSLVKFSYLLSLEVRYAKARDG